VEEKIWRFARTPRRPAAGFLRPMVVDGCEVWQRPQQYY
jgi:hypothetical protein